MANTIPLVVSGQVGSTQPSIIMTLVNSVPYYLVTDANNIPYFQPLYQDVTTGLAVFEQSASRVSVAVGNALGGSFAIISELTIPGGPFLVDPTLFRVIAPGPASSGSPSIPIETLSYTDTSLVACGYQYILANQVLFYISANWSANPGAQSIASIQLLPPTNSFFVFPIDGLYGSDGKPSSSDVFTAIYNDIIGKTATTFFFSNYDAYRAGAGEPFYYCPTSVCGPSCFGTCNGQYSGCYRLKDLSFSCNIGASTSCKILSLLPFMIPILICLIAFAIVFFTNKEAHHPGGPKNPVFPKNIKILLSALMIIPAILCIVLILISVPDTSISSSYLKAICRTTGDYQ